MRRNLDPWAEAVMCTHLEKNLEVLTVSSDIEEDPTLLEELVVPLLRYLDGKLEKYAEPSDVGSYSTRMKLAATTVTAKQVESLTTNRAAAKALLEEKEKQLQELEAKRATVDLRDRLKASWMAFNEESRRVEELTADPAKRDQAHAAELAAKTKELAEFEATRSSELKHLKKLEVSCNEMRS
ncbi:hypothetical protein AXG93_3052s1170 [Marchantia polymorpha subsp. ruderalis]|uniref:Uncharacterized protein n=1 Tax=Marchantia polymorpha subsp. ruderalis TaxID=1480154 RepID=A0A176WID1_MARPO|nr:hypothetical protein AXG93_3052s1170 [Marchantia polymorpha subsp. ruderalis]